MGLNDPQQQDGTKSNLVIVGGDGKETAVARQRMMMGTTKTPCQNCKSWHRDAEKLVRHFLAHGLMVKPDGTIWSPIHRDFQGRVGMEINVRNFGFCRFHMMPSEDLHSCSNWVPAHKLAAHLAQR